MENQALQYPGQKNRLPLKQSENLMYERTKDVAMLVIKDLTRADSGQYFLTMENSAGRKEVCIIVNVFGVPKNIKGIIEFVDITADTAVLKWSAPEDDGGSEITNYVIEKKVTGSESWSSVSANCIGEAITASKLVTKCEYVFRIAAENKYGLGDFTMSDRIVARHPFRVPSLPPQPEVIEASGSSMSIVWGQCHTDGGSKILGYHVDRKERDAFLWTRVTGTPTEEREFESSDLTEGLEYQYRVIAINKAGFSKPSEPSEFTRAQNPVGSPGCPTCTDTTRDSVALSWTPPSYDGGSEITGYLVEKRSGENGRWLKCNYKAVQDCEFTVSALSSGESYQFRVMARNAAGTVSKPSKTSAMIVCRDDYKPPTVMLDTSILDGVTIRAGAILKLKAMVTGKPFPKIAWHHDGIELTPNAQVEMVNEKTATTLIVKDTERKNTGSYQVCVKNACSSASMDCKVEILDKPSYPGAPISFSDVDNTSVTLSWNECKDNGGANIENYIIEKRETSRLSWSFVTANCTTTTYAVNRLVKNREYQFRISAQNKFGVGAGLVSGPVVTIVSYVVPDAPGQPVRVTSDEDSITIAFTTPVCDGGSEVTGYHIERKEKKSSRWIKVTRQPIKDLQYVISDLVENNSYEFRVYAENAAGMSEPSEPSVMIVCREPACEPEAPGIVRVSDTTSTTAALIWSPPLCDGGSAIIGYLVESKLISKEEVIESKIDEDEETSGDENEDEWQRVNDELIAECEYIVPNLIPGNKYCLRVSAVNAAGTGEPTKTSGKIVTIDKIEPPSFQIDADFKSSYAVRAGASLRLLVLYHGRPRPTIKWHKEESRLNESTEIINTSYSTALHISSTTRDDSGKYCLTLENSAGEKTLNLSVKILDSPGPVHLITCKDVSRASVTLAWEAPINDGGAHVKNYIVEKREVSRRSWQAVTTKCSKTLFKIENLQEGSTYSFRVIPENEYGVGVPKQMEQDITVTEVPSMPEHLDLVDITKSSITSTWTKPRHDGGSRINGYILEIAEKGSDNFFECARVKQGVFKHTVNNLKQGVEYEMRVRARNGAGISEPRYAFSTVITKDKQDPPSMDLKPIYNGIISVRSGSMIEAHIPIFGAPLPEVTWIFKEDMLKESDRISISQNEESTTLVIKSAKKSDSGQYELKLKNEHGEKSSIIQVVVLDKPGPPTGPIEFTNITAESITISWQPPKETGGSDISNYSIDYREFGRATWSNYNPCTTRTSIKIKELARYTQYQFRVTAETRFGLGDPLVSEICRADHQYTQPKQPGSLRVLGATKDSVSVAWEDPAQDGGSPVTGYYVEKKEKHSVLWQRLNDEAITRKSFNATGLAEGLEYQFRVLAENAAGIGKPSEETDFVMAISVVGMPSMPEVLEMSSHTILLTWKPPTIDGGSKIIGYNIERRHVPDGRWLKCNFSDIAACKFEVGGLAPADKYEFRVMAKNAVGTIGMPSEVLGPIQCQPNNVPPTIELDSSLMSDVIRVRAGNLLRLEAEISGKPEPNVFWYKGDKELENLSRIKIISTSKSSTLCIKDCERDDTARYTLVLRNNCGEKKTTINVKILDKPSAPVGPVKFFKIASDTCCLTWKPPAEDGGADITRYIVEKKDTSRINWVPVYESLETTTCTVKKLTSGSEYMFRVSAVNKYGAGPSLVSSNVIAKNQFGIADAPGTPEIVSTTKDSVSIMWTRPENDGGSEITNYVVERRQPQGRWIRCTKDKSLTDLRYNITNLRHLSFFEFRVCAENAAGLGTFSDTSMPAKVQEPLYPPATPAHFKVVDITKSSVNLTWKAPTYDGGCPIEGYILEMAECVPDEEEEWEKVHKSKHIKTTEYTVAGLVEDHEYIFRIFAVNEISESEMPAKISEPVLAKDILEDPSIKLSGNLSKSITIKAGRHIVLGVEITGRPLPSVSWSKTPNGENLSERSSVETHTGSSSLKVMKCDRYDAGIYTVAAENSSGKAESSVTVKVLDTPGKISAIEVQEVTRNSVTIAWEAPDINGGSEVQSYVVERREQTRRTWDTIENRCTATTYKVTGLQEGVRYYFKVSPENEFGVGEECVTEKSVLACEQPSPPASIEVTDLTNTSVSLMWSTPNQDGGTPIEGYQLEVKEKDTEKWKNGGNTAQLKHIVKGLKEGKDYLFRVKAKNASGYGEPLELLSSVTVKEQPVKPAVKLIESSKHVSIKAGEVLVLKFSVCGRPEPNIAMFKNCASFDKSKRILLSSCDGVAMLTVKDCKVEDHGDYKLTATNDFGSASEVVIVTVLDVPSSPTGPIKFSDITGTSLVLTWKPPKYDGGAMITNYKIERKETHGRNWMTVSDTVTRTFMKVTKLEENGEYIFRISAQNRFGVGQSLTSESTIVKNRYGVPGPPSCPQILEVLSDSITLCWMEPVNNGGIEILGYIVERKEKKGKRWIQATRQPVKETHYTSTGLIDGIEYIHRIFAVNEKGEGKPSKETTAVLCCDPVDPPSAPCNPRVVEITKSTLSLAWDKPEREGGSKVVGYFIEMRKGEEWWERCNTTPIRFTHYSLKGMTDGGQYLIRLMAVNAGGVGEAVEIEKPITIQDESGLPKFIVDDELLNKGITVKEGDDLPIPIHFKCQPKPVVSWYKQNTKDKDLKSRCMISVNEYSTELFIKEVAKEDAGIYGVKLENKCGTKEVQIAVAVCCVPATPEGPIIFTNITPTSVCLSWSMSPSNDVNKYIVSYQRQGKKIWIFGTVCDDCTNCAVDGLEKNAAYLFKVEAVNEYGRSLALQSNEAIIPRINLLPPHPPHLVEINEVTKDKICLSWTPVLEDGGSPVAGYFVQYKETTSDSWIRVNKVLTKNNTLAVQDVVGGSEYHFRVVSVNNIGDGKPSKVSESVICKDPDGVPSSPEDLEIQNLTRNSVSIAWNEPSYRGTTPVIGYLVQIRKSGSHNWENTHKDIDVLTEQSHHITELQESTAYEVRIISVNSAGHSRPTALEKPIITKKPAGEAPSVIEPLTDENCSVGDTVILACRIYCKPEPDISWLRNGSEISASDKYKIITEGEMNSLHIHDVSMFDSGEYALEATNPVGQMKTKCLVTVSGAPVLDNKSTFSENVMMKAGESLNIHVPYIGLPAADATWSKGGLSIQIGDNCEIDTTNSYTHLRINNATRIDSGKYTVVLSNAHGKNAYSVNVEICDKPTKPLCLTTYDITNSGLLLAWKEPEDCGGLPVTRYIVEKSEQNASTSKWELVTSQAIKTAYKVQGLTEKHSYMFRVFAKNAYGLSEPTETEKSVVVRTQTNAPSTPTNISVNGITADACILNWKQPKADGTKVTSYLVEKRDNENTEWRRVTIDTITETVCCVTGLLHGLSYEFRITSENEGGFSDPSEVTQPITTKENVRVAKPRFMEPMRDIVAKPGQNVTLFSKVSGQPKPIIKWYKGGREVVQDCKHQMRYGRGNNYSMNISRACIEDEGPYTVRAINIGGSTSCTINVTIQLPARVLLPRYMENEATYCKVHEAVSFKIPIEGSPMPEVTWSKSGKPITPEASGYNVVTTCSFTTLMIKDAWRSDSGFYNITLNNRFGSHQATVQLLVADVPNQPERLKVSGISRDSVDLSWIAPSDDGGKPILKYIIEKSLASSDRWMKVSSASTTRYTLCGLSGRTSYQFRIRAENECGQSNPSTPTGIVTTEEDPTMAATYDEMVDVSGKMDSKNAKVHTNVNVLGKYNLLEELGRGAFGNVHRAQEISTGKIWAAKIVKTEDESNYAAVKREIAVMKKLHHPHLLQLHEIFESKGEITMIVQFVSGGDLFERITSDMFDLTENVCIQYIKQIAEALAFMHEVNAVHLDVKPENILFETRKSNNLKLVDFGASRELRSGEALKIAYGTPDFCAPEVVSNDSVGRATDMWSLGVLTYILLSGVSPFKGENDNETLKNVNDAEWDFNHEAWANISDAALDFIDRLLVREKRERMSARDALLHPWLSSDAENIDDLVAEKRSQIIPTMLHRKFFKANIIFEASTVVVSLGRLAYGGSLRSCKGKSVAKLKVETVDMNPCLGPLHHQFVSEGSEIKLESRIYDAEGDEDITWFKDNIRLEENEKYQFDYDEESDKFSLIIKDAQKSDDSTYRCKVENGFGSSTQQCELCVQLKSGKWTRVPRTIYFTKHKKIAKRSSGEVMRSLRHAPEFTFPLYNRTIYAGEDVTFAVTVTVHPTPDVTWYHNAQKVKFNSDDKKYIGYQEKGLYRLTICDCDIRDGGDLMVVARNKYGDDTCKASLIVKRKPGKDEVSLRPTFRRLMANQSVHECQSARFDIRVTGHPRPEIIWEKDGKLLRADNHHEMIWEDQQSCYLLIKDVFQPDAGIYKVTARNPAGAASSKASLMIKKPIRRVDGSASNEYARDKGYRKADRLAALKGGDADHNLPESARQALLSAGAHIRPVKSASMFFDDDDNAAAERERIRHEKLVASLPYSVPQPIEHSDDVLEEDTELLSYEPRSATRWYRKVQASNEMYVAPNIHPQHPQRSSRVRKHVMPDKAYVIPDRRITTMKIPNQDDFEEGARSKTPIREGDGTSPLKMWRKFYHPMADDEKYLQPIDEYLMEQSSIEYLAEEAARDQTPVRHIRQKQDADTSLEVSYSMPSKELESRSFSKMRERHDAVDKIGKLRSSTKKTSEDDILRPMASKISHYSNVPCFRESSSETSPEKVSRSLGEMTWYEKRLQKMKMKPTVEEMDFEREYQQEVSAISQRKTANSRRSHQNAAPVRRRSFEFEELTRPVSQMISNRKRHSSSSSSSDSSDEVSQRSPRVTKSGVRFSGFSPEKLETSPQVTDEAPKFQLKMRSHVVSAGMNTKFTAAVKAKPQANIRWQKDGMLIFIDGHKYKMTDVNGVVSLEIKNCGREDTGSYRCLARNDHGEVSAYATLEVTGSNSRDFRTSSKSRSGMYDDNWRKH